MKNYRVIESKKEAWNSQYGYPKKVQVRKLFFFWNTIAYFSRDKNAIRANEYMKVAEQRNIK